jgi:predicted nuclease of predicted toxin-antitoxin system
MRLLADECFDERLAKALRAAGHDVVRIPAQSGLDDLAVATRAERDNRVLLTHDTDFGGIALRHGQPRTGVVILRTAVADLESVATRLVQLIVHAGDDLSGAITVLDDRGVRSRAII